MLQEFEPARVELQDPKLSLPGIYARLRGLRRKLPYVPARQVWTDTIIPCGKISSTLA
jgi:hypothetical protein